MELLQSLVEKGNIKFTDELTDAIPDELMKKIQKNIKDGAKEKRWANALELVHKAYEVAAVQRPLSPNMKNAWKQYEENIAIAVNQLAIHHGMDGDWRMSSAMFREAFNRTNHKLFKVTLQDEGHEQTYNVRAEDINHVMTGLSETTRNYETKMSTKGNRTLITFYNHGIRQRFRVGIEEI